MTAQLIYGLPLITSLVCFLLRNEKLNRLVALVASVLMLGISLWFLPLFISTASEYPLLTGSFDFQADGLSYIMLLLVNIVNLLIVIAGFIERYRRSNLFYGLYFLSVFALTGVFTTHNLLMFYVFWELALIPLYFIIGYWNKEGNNRVVQTFFIYTVLGSLMMLAAFIYLYTLTPGAHSFNFEVIYALNLSVQEKTWIYLAMMFAFAIKIPLFPFHSWQPETYRISPMMATMLMAGIMLKMGLYGMLRLLIPLCNEVFSTLVYPTSALIVAGIIYASVIAIRQREIKRLFAFSSMAHVGLIALAILTLSVNALQGVVIQMLSHGINVVGLFFAAELIFKRTSSSEVKELGGIAKNAPGFALMFFIVLLASISFPFTNTFVGEFLMLLGIFTTVKLWAILAGLSIVFGAVYMLWLYQRVMLGEPPKFAFHFIDLKPVEWILFSTIVCLILSIGIYPTWILKIAEPAINHILQTL